MRNFLNSRHTNYNEIGDKVDSFCEDCEKKWFPFSFLWWDDNKKNIAGIKRKDNGILVIDKILSLINSILSSIKDIYNRIDVLEPPIIAEDTVELKNTYLEVGVTDEDFQEDLNIALYEKYIYLDENKIEKPLTESETDNVKIVALNEQGESVYVSSNNLGKVKSVNGKTGDVILKTSDLENDSDFTTNSKLNKEIQDRISADNLKLDKPTIVGNTSEYPDVVVVDSIGNSAKVRASEFGKVKTVNGKIGDVVLKTSDLQNDSDYTTNATLTAHTSNKSNPHNVTKSQIGLGNVDNTSDLNKPISTATQTELNKKINKPTTNNTNQFVILGDGSTAPKNDFGKVDKVMGVSPDANKNVDISGVAMNWTNESHTWSAIPNKSGEDTYNKVMVLNADGQAGTKDAGDLGKNFSNTDLEITENRKHTGTASLELAMPMIYSNASQRFPGLVDKSADATYNALLGMDNQGNVGKLTALGNVLESGLQTISSAQALRIGQLLNGGQGSAGAISVNLISPPIVQNRFDSVEYVLLRGANLLLNSTDMSISICDENKNVIQQIPNNQIINNSSTELIFYYNFYQFVVGTYYIKITSGVKVYYTTLDLRVVQEVENINLNGITWETNVKEGVTPNPSNILNGPTFSITSPKGATNYIIESYKTSELFKEGEDFYIEAEIDWLSRQTAGQPEYDQSNIGIGYSNIPNDILNNMLIGCKWSITTSSSFYIVKVPNGTIVVSNVATTTQNMVIIKTGNLLRVIIGRFTYSTIISNNSGYSFLLQNVGRPVDCKIQGSIIKAFKFN